MPSKSCRRGVLVCPACNRAGLTQTGYYSHLRQSKNPACNALLRRSNLATDSNTSDSEDGDESESRPPRSSSNANNLNSDTADDIANANDAVRSDALSQSPFAGDAFGTVDDYGDDDFGQDGPLHPFTDNVDNGNNDDDLATPRLSGDEDTSDEEDELDPELVDPENGWEPPRAGAQTGQDHTNDMTIDEDGPSHGDHEQDTARRSEVEQRVNGGQPKKVIRYSEVYPDRQCGSTIAFDRPTDKVYETSLTGLDSEWAPFMSKMEWEVAKWAKLRGPGSTSFSELLAIEGVSCALIYCHTKNVLNVIFN